MKLHRLHAIARREAAAADPVTEPTADGTDAPGTPPPAPTKPRASRRRATAARKK